MFYYISFLRPPPLYAPLSGNVYITPQVANDLRTEFFNGSLDIYYSWTLVSATALSRSFTTPATNTNPSKLTTWRQENAYKEIPVPLPPGVREGQQWRLFLTPGGTRAPLISTSRLVSIPLDGELGVGNTPFPVMSMPITFTTRAPAKSAKQERIERLYELRPPTDGSGPPSEGVILKLVEQTSFDLDKKVWDSGVGLSSWLIELERSAPNEQSGLICRLRDRLFGGGVREILELGAGIGIVGIALAALRSTGSRSMISQQETDRIVLTDLESAIPLLQHNISTNKPHYASIAIEPAVLDWDDPLPEFVKEFPEGFDAIIMADVTYNTASFPSLVRTLSQAIKIGTKQPLILMGYKERDAAERSLWDLMTDAGIKFEKIAERIGAGGAPVEVWVGRALNNPV